MSYQIPVEDHFRMIELFVSNWKLICYWALKMNQKFLLDSWLRIKNIDPECKPLENDCQSKNGNQTEWNGNNASDAAQVHKILKIKRLRLCNDLRQYDNMMLLMI